MTHTRQSTVLAAAMFAGLAGWTACGGSEPLVSSRVHRPLVGAALFREVSDADRFRIKEPAVAFDFVLPNGWSEQPLSSQYVSADLSIAGGGRCTVSLAGGGVLANINRWRVEQLGLEPIDDAAVAKLPRVELFGREAIEVDLAGPFRGMSGEMIDPARMLCVILPTPTRQVVVKAVGPAELMAAQKANFQAFCQTLRPADVQAPSAGNSSAGNSSAGNSSAGNSAGAATTRDGGGSPPVDLGKLRWQRPEGWTEKPGASLRVVTFKTGAGPDALECVFYHQITGGLVANAQRWYDQMGKPKPSADVVRALPTMPLAGRRATKIDIRGKFGGGMGGKPIDDAQMIGLICDFGTDALFVKMIGSVDAIAQHRAAFEGLLASLRFEE